jgi:isopenicillin-N N-acyltransferase-like protein
MPIPIIETRGTHYQVGYQIGVAARESLQTLHAQTRTAFRAQWHALLTLAPRFLEVTEQHLPRVLQELRGCAVGANVPFDDLFLMSIEELLYEEVRGAEMWRQREGERGSRCASLPITPSPDQPISQKGCTDLAAAPPATEDGHIWIAHNNDLGRKTQEHLFVTHFRAEGEPDLLAVTVGGIFISIGLNRAGIALTGNQLTANDSRVGVPRLLVVRDILARDNFDDALNAARLPERASSYNNLISARDGRIVNVEGSATACALVWADDGATFHANHYLDAQMQRFESLPDEAHPSAARCARAQDYARKYHGRIGRARCEQFLRDHVFAPWSVCKHAGLSVTVFSSIIDLTEQELWLTRGNPCESEYERYAFDAAPLSAPLTTSRLRAEPFAHALPAR